MTNFDYLAEIPGFKTFADAAIAAERVYSIDASTSAVNARRSLEFAIRWIYSVNKSMPKYQQATLSTLLFTKKFRKFTGNSLHWQINYIRILGNNAAHCGNKITPGQAEFALKILFVFLDFLAYCYAPKYWEHTFNTNLLRETSNEDLPLCEKAINSLKKSSRKRRCLLPKRMRRKCRFQHLRKMRKSLNCQIKNVTEYRKYISEQRKHDKDYRVKSHQQQSKNIRLKPRFQHHKRRRRKSNRKNRYNAKN